MAELTELLEKLESRPEDWDFRLVVVEKLAESGELDRARNLVRDSPDGPVPYHVQSRLWAALSGDSAIRVIDDGSASEGGKPNLVAKAKVVRRENDAKAEPFRVPPPPKRPQPDPDSGESKPYRHSQAASEDAEKPAADPKHASAPKIKRIAAEPANLRRQPRSSAAADDKKAAAAEKFYLSGLEDVALPNPRRTRPTASGKFSAFTVAILVHFALVLTGAFIVVYAPGARAPVIAVLAAPPLDEVVIKKSIVQKTEISKPAAPSASATAVVTVEGESVFVAPQIDRMSRTFDANLIDSGIGASRGLSFEGVGVESDVSFFGIAAGGRRICFIIEATPSMLVDEMGGMFAYNKVKAEIGAMLGGLNRGTAFNIIVYEGKKLSMFREEPVRALPSNVRRAIEWMEPINRDYEALGLRQDYTDGGITPGAVPIHHNDNAHYSKAIQAALEQDVNAVFCIGGGWRGLSRSLSPEDQVKMAEYSKARREQLDAVQTDFKQEYDPKEVAAWRAAQEKAREWLRKENEARISNGMAPKVVLSMNEIIQKVAPGARPPRGLKTPPPPPPAPPPPEVERLPAYTTEDVEEQIKNVITQNYGKNQPDRPSVNLVLFLGEDQDIGADEDHFKTFTRQNKGKLKILRGLAALSDVTDY